MLRAYPNVKGHAGLGLDRCRRHRPSPSRSAAWKRAPACSAPPCPPSPRQYLETGAVDGIGFWDPSLAGYAMNKVAQMVIDGEEVSDGMDLGLEGYENVTLDGKVIYGQAWVNVDAENMADYPF